MRERHITTRVRRGATVYIDSLTIHGERFPEQDLYPFNLEIFRTTRLLEFASPVTFFVGENGSGKSTLIRAIARRANIHIWKGDDRPRHRKSPFEDELYRFLRLSWTHGIVSGAFFASEIFRNFSQLVDEWAAADPGVLRYFGDESLMSMSHGQRHMAYFEHRFSLPGLYLLDEPDTALSPKSLEKLRTIVEKAGDGGTAQFVIATHSPLLLSLPGARIVSFDTSPLSEVTYRETEHYRVYRKFFEVDEA